MIISVLVTVNSTFILVNWNLLEGTDKVIMVFLVLSMPSYFKWKNEKNALSPYISECHSFFVSLV